MPYTEESERLLMQEDKFSLHEVKWGREGQCVSKTPNPKMIVRFRDVEVSVSAMSAHKARRIALDIGELFG